MFSCLIIGATSDTLVLTIKVPAACIDVWQGKPSSFMAISNTSGYISCHSFNSGTISKDSSIDKSVCFSVPSSVSSYTDWGISLAILSSVFKSTLYNLHTLLIADLALRILKVDTAAQWSIPYVSIVYLNIASL